MQGVYGFNFEQIEINSVSVRKHKKCVYLTMSSGTVTPSKDILEKTAFEVGDEVILYADKKRGIFCLSPAPNKGLVGSVKFTKSGGGMRLCSKDMCTKISIIAEQIGYTGTEFDARVLDDGSILFYPKEE